MAVPIIDTILPGSGYPNISSFTHPIPPNIAGLRGIYAFGRSLESSRANLISGGPSLEVVGSPVISELGASLSKTDYFDTTLPQTTDETFFVVAKARTPGNAANGSLLVGNYFADGSTVSGDTLGFIFASSAPRIAQVAQTAESATANANIVMTGADTEKFNIFAGRIDGHGNMAQVFRSVDGVITSSDELVLAGRALSSRSLLIGSNYSSINYNGPSDILLVAIGDAAMSAAQIAENIEFWRGYYAGLGIDTL